MVKTLPSQRLLLHWPQQQRQMRWPEQISPSPLRLPVAALTWLVDSEISSKFVEINLVSAVTVSMLKVFTKHFLILYIFINIAVLLFFSFVFYLRFVIYDIG